MLDIEYSVITSDVIKSFDCIFIKVKHSICGIFSKVKYSVKPQLHCHDFGHDGATTHPDLSSRDASA